MNRNAKRTTENSKRKTARVPVLRLLFTVYCSAFLFAGCNKSPFDSTRNASGGALNKFGVAPALVVFDSELTTGGGAFEYPSGDNQVLSFNDTSSPISYRSIRYMWNGQPVSNPSGTPNPEVTFAGFDLCHVVVINNNLAVYTSTPGRNLQAAGYTHVSFYARGSLSTDTVLEVQVAGGASQPCVTLSTDGRDDVASPGTPCGRVAQLTGNWQQYSIPISNANLAAVKDFFKATFIFNPPYVGSTAPGQGGVAYFDVIEYTP